MQFPCWQQQERLIPALPGWLQHLLRLCPDTCGPLKHHSRVQGPGEQEAATCQPQVCLRVWSLAASQLLAHNQLPGLVFLWDGTKNQGQPPLPFLHRSQMGLSLTSTPYRSMSALS